MSKESNVTQRKSKTALTLHFENQLNELGDQLEVIRDEADSLLAAENPTKRQRKVLLDTANSLIALQKDTTDNLPNLIPAECSKYSISRLRTEKKFNARVISPDTSGLRTQCFDVAGIQINLPQNRTQYSATEVCAI